MIYCCLSCTQNCKFPFQRKIWAGTYCFVSYYFGIVRKIGVSTFSYISSIGFGWSWVFWHPYFFVVSSAIFFVVRPTKAVAQEVCACKCNYQNTPKSYHEADFKLPLGLWTITFFSSFCAFTWFSVAGLLSDLTISDKKLIYLHGNRKSYWFQESGIHSVWNWLNFGAKIQISFGLEMIMFGMINKYLPYCEAQCINFAKSFFVRQGWNVMSKAFKGIVDGLHPFTFT